MSEKCGLEHDGSKNAPVCVWVVTNVTVDKEVILRYTTDSREDKRSIVVRHR